MTALKETIIALRREGVGPREIARRLGVTPGCVTGTLNRAGMCSAANAGENVPRGEAHPKARVTEVEVLEMRSRLEAGERQASIARDFGVPPMLVQKVASRRTWRHI